MSLRLYDFQCAKGHKHEALVQPDERTVQCPKCRRPAQRLIPAPRCVLEGLTGDFPGAAIKWEKTRESHMRKEAKNKRNHDTYE